MGCSCIKAKGSNGQQKSRTIVNQKGYKYADKRVQKKLSKMDVNRGVAIGGCQIQNKDQRLDVHQNRYNQQNQRGISKDNQMAVQWQIQKQKEADKLEMQKGGNYKLIYKK